MRALPSPHPVAEAATLADVILIPKQLRMEWTDVLALDQALSHTAFRVGCVIGSHFNRFTGDTHISQETIARVMGIAERTVWGSIVELERLGYLIIKRRELGVRLSDGRRVCGGKGVANEYLPAFERSQVAATFSGRKLATRCDLIWDQRSQNPASKVATDCDPTLASSSKKNPTRAGAGARATADRAGGEQQRAFDGKAAGCRVTPGTPAFGAWLERAEMINATKLLKVLHDAMRTGEPAQMSSEFPSALPGRCEAQS